MGLRQPRLSCVALLVLVLVVVVVDAYTRPANADWSKDFYKVLGVSASASQHEIKKVVGGA